MYLNTHTYYSLRYGTMSVEKLLSDLAEGGFNQAALTDINTTSACMDFLRLAPEKGIKPVLGVDFRKGVQRFFVLLAMSDKGFEHINN